jgi:DNA-binding CsgD family transcriptional regulator
MPTARARTALNRQFRFSFYHRRPVHCDFSGGQITSDAGLLPLRAFDQRHHLTRDGVQLLSDPRDDERVRHHSLALLRQRIYQIVAGYEDANDADRLRHDPTLQIVADQELREALGSQPTLSRWENAPSARDLVRLNDALLDQFIRLCGKQVRQRGEILLDIDSTDDPTHGQQQLSIFKRGLRPAYVPPHAYLRASQRMPIGRTVATGQCLQSCSHCSDAAAAGAAAGSRFSRRAYQAARRCRFCSAAALRILRILRSFSAGPGRGRNVWPAAIATPGFRSAASPVFAIVPASAVDLIAAIRAVARGEAVCPPQLCKVLFDTLAGAREYTPSVRKIAVSLTRRQQELIPMIAPGLTNKEIASHLNLSEQTVKNHIHRMLRRIRADDRSRVIEIACAQDASD